MRAFAALWVLLLSLSSESTAYAGAPIAIGSKTFSESHVLAELSAQILEAEGFVVQRRLGLGGTLITFEALRAGELDVYPEYTGTLIRAVFEGSNLTEAGLEDKLEALGLRFPVRFGFNNTYALAMPRALAEERGLKRISDLKPHTDLRFGFSHEFLRRSDGWPALRSRYQLPQSAVGIEHTLAYRALQAGQLDATDAYSTDAELRVFDLKLLDDDRELFPTYFAGLLMRNDLPPAAVSVLLRLRDRLDEARMQRLNQRVATAGETPAAVASAFLREAGLTGTDAPEVVRRSTLGRNTLVHLKLTGLALALGCLTAIPLALLISRYARLASALQYAAGLIQTIPALALLALLIPLLGLGQTSAVAALFLYSLLPIMRNTLAGLFAVDPLLREVAASLGMTRSEQLFRIELPLAMPMILAGIRTAAVISIGTATLAAFVGAGGLGEPIITGLSLNDHRLILEGAIPAAGLAVLAECFFELLERYALPAHLRRRHL